jgi:hypothetical protein
MARTIVLRLASKSYLPSKPTCDIEEVLAKTIEYVLCDIVQLQEFPPPPQKHQLQGMKEICCKLYGVWWSCLRLS